MSRIGKLPIEIKEGVEVTIEGSLVKVKGPKGDLSVKLNSLVVVTKEGNTVKVSIKNETREARELYGLSRTLIANLVIGVSEGFEKKLSIHGVGFKAAVQGNKLVLNVGFSHSVDMVIPEGIETKIEKNIIVISGADKVEVGQFAANVRAVKKPEPYKGKGIKYENERIRRKAGKAAKTAA